MFRVPVKTSSHNYDVLIGSELLAQAGALLRSAAHVASEKIIVVSSESVWRHYSSTLTSSLDRVGLNWHPLLIGDGEQAKTLRTVEQAAEQLVALGADRSSIVVALGGGVIGDMAGFLAAIYMRGIRFVQIPTTLLAQVDASVGGKTGVNLVSGKNLIGSFHQPECVIIDPVLTCTLSDREFRAGLFEVIKSGAIADAKLFAFMETQRERILARDAEAVAYCVEASVRVKAHVVSVDERESGLRRILNFGHTIGHALEAEAHYSGLLHGEAVGWGMIAAAQIALLHGTSSEALARRIEEVVLNYGPLPAVAGEAESIVARIAGDKKTIGGKTHFVLVREVGQAAVVSDVSKDAALKAVEYVQELAHAHA
jgi:3-dehydroquinate synthase